MRTLSLFAAGLALVSLPAMAEAQSRQSLYIDAKPRSWLDPGKVTEPGASHNYVYDIQASSMPRGGAAFANPMTDRYPRSSIKIDIPAPDFLRKQ
ncbi:MAG: hypothetical protein MUF11_09420 [Beijerinckiaceae bacterium]|jgi:hypothetical protein|nr:hypothetical protein [Beijerinckiaceae bacterium]